MKRFIALAGLSCAIASPVAAAPAMFEASFIFHAWGNDVTSGAYDPYATNDWTALPLGYDCQHWSQYTVNGSPSSRWCSPDMWHHGHPATGAWTRSIGAGTPQSLVVQQSDFGVALTLFERGMFFRSRTAGYFYLQSFSYATFVNAAGAFFAAGGPAAAVGYANQTGMGTGTWRIRAGENAFGGAMGLLGKFGATGFYVVPAHSGSWYAGHSSWNMIKALGRPYRGTQIGTDTMGMPLYQNPYVKTDKWYRTPTKGPIKVNTVTAVGWGTLWTTGAVAVYARAGDYPTSLHRTGYDNRNASGVGTIQLVTPTLTHWSGHVSPDHTAHIGILKIQVAPEPGAVLLVAAGAGALLLLHRASRRR